MRVETEDLAAGNRELRFTMRAQGLEPDELQPPIPGDPQAENHLLRDLLRWVNAYRETPDRNLLEEKGLFYPPVDPDFDLDSDWLRFERWMQGKSLAWTFSTEFGAIPDSEAMTDKEVERHLASLEETLATRQVILELPPEIPSRVVYDYLRRYLAEASFDVVAENTVTHITGCEGDCESCFMQRWCDIADEDVQMHRSGNPPPPPAAETPPRRGA